MERRRTEDVIYKKVERFESSSSMEEDDTSTIQKSLLLHPTLSLPLLNMIDMFSVSLVVPLLFQYYKDAGVTDASTRELLSSIFSSSQIIGGLMLGALTDAGVLRRRTVLFISFGGSSLAYFLIVAGGLPALIISRVLVGLVKQTQTVSTTLIARYTTKENRAVHMGRLAASSTVAWIVGPSVGALLYKNVDHRAPALLACALFILNVMLAAILLPHQEHHHHHGDDEEERKSVDSKNEKKKKSFVENLKSCFTSKSLGSVISSILIFTWFTRATSYTSMASYYEQMYGMEPHHRGYLSSYQSILSFVVQSFVVGPLLSRLGGERRAAVFSACLLSLLTLLELQRSLYIFLILICPALSVALALMGLSLRSLVTHVAPKESLGSVLAALDVLQNATSVTVPFYRTMLFSLLTAGGRDNNDGAAPLMKGDPEPTTWIISSFFHWVVGAIVMAYFLLGNDNEDGGSDDKDASKRTNRIKNKGMEERKER